MKAKDIAVGTDYAISSRRDLGLYAARVRVLAVNVTHAGGYHPGKHLVRVQHIGSDGLPKPVYTFGRHDYAATESNSTEYVPLSRVRMTWSDYLEWCEAERERQRKASEVAQERAREYTKNSERLSLLVPRLKAALGETPYFSAYIEDVRSVSIRYLKLDDFERLVIAMEKEAAGA